MTARTNASLAEAALDADADAVVTVDATGTITSWNRAASGLFGYTAAEAVGQTLALIVPAEFRSRHAEAFHAAVANASLRHGGRPARILAATASGEMLEAAFTLGLMTGADGSVAGVVASLRRLGEPERFV